MFIIELPTNIEMCSFEKSRTKNMEDLTGRDSTFRFASVYSQPSEYHKIFLSDLKLSYFFLSFSLVQSVQHNFVSLNVLSNSSYFRRFTQFFVVPSFFFTSVKICIFFSYLSSKTRSSILFYSKRIFLCHSPLLSNQIRLNCLIF